MDIKENKIELSIKPIESSTMADKVEERLREYFREQKFQPGDAIPKEMELAEALGVSRNVVREALSRFRMLGMVESRKKRGMILAMPDVLGTFERVLDPHILDDTTNKELFELRLVIEMGITDLLFARKTDQDIVVLRKIIEKENHAQTNKEKLQCEVDFHATLYRIAGNTLLKRFQKMLIPVFEYVENYERKHMGPTMYTKVSHNDIVDVLEKGSPDEYRKKMKEHLKPKFDHIST